MKYNFGKYAVLTSKEYHFKEEPEWYWKIRAANSGDEFYMNQYLAENLRTVLYDGKEQSVPPIWMDTMYQEIAVLFDGTNIPNDPSKPDDPILKEGAKPAQVIAILKAMPQVMVEELWYAVKEINPTWGPQMPKLESQDEKAQAEGSTETSSSPG